jgi:hypothetical protein
MTTTPKVHYSSVTQKPIADGLLLSRARFLFGFRLKVKDYFSDIGVV